MTARIATITGVGVAIAGAVGAAPDPLPADSPFVGVMWSFVVPAILFAVALGATVLLYRHFAGRDR
jgi:hypothetical protein